ncbi:hypothetical protein [Pelagicoccus albus]|uniref:Uncharacterized protein n=1 Tax=Pelagicoccus albus TaxID=415222 RepID=A0A7X1E9F2_9BACT|nr:hypothetical protein [Pelagicoccus albus]MBC2607354.1 hypothetical protein [Pelagicoccus albus]
MAIAQIPPQAAPCWKRFAAKGLNGFETKMLGLQLLFKRFELESLPVEKRVQQLHAFFVKYEKILQKEIAQLTKL